MLLGTVSDTTPRDHTFEDNPARIIIYLRHVICSLFFLFLVLFPFYENLDYSGEEAPYMSHLLQDDRAYIRTWIMFDDAICLLHVWRNPNLSLW